MQAPGGFLPRSAETFQQVFAALTLNFQGILSRQVHKPPLQGLRPPQDPRPSHHRTPCPHRAVGGHPSDSATQHMGPDRWCWVPAPAGHVWTGLPLLRG